MRKTSVLCYWGGKIVETSEGLSYNCEYKKLLRLRQDAKYGEILDQLFEKIGVSRDCSQLKLTCRLPYMTGNNSFKYMPLHVVDDDSLEMMLDVTNQTGRLFVELYVEIEDLPTPVQDHGPYPLLCGGVDIPTLQSQSNLTGLLHPGPLDGRVLYDQKNHRSDVIWDTGVEQVLKCRRDDVTVHLYHAPQDIRVQRCLHQAGFYGLYHLGYSRLDRPLITALVERWRPETHTFHMPPGECTITLQDIEVLAGVRVDGEPVTGLDESYTPEQWQPIVERLLGARPDLREFDGARLRLVWITNRFMELPVDADDEAVRQHTRAVILLLLGGHYLSDKSGNLVKLIYLPLLENLETCGQYSWGSAILATLYRELCRASHHLSKDIAGPLVLLQLWAWIRFTHIRPQSIDHLAPYPDIHAPADGGPALPVYPYGYRWRAASRTYNPIVVGHNLRHFRDQFDSMREEHMVWEPYRDVLEGLPDYCVGGRAVWHARVPLICYAIVEHHYPNRVLRQFGMRQREPIDCIRDDALHRLDRRGQGRTDWAHRHQLFVAAWGERRQAIVDTEPYHERMRPNDPYMVWYGRITRRYIRPAVHIPGHGFQPTAGIQTTMMHTIARCYLMALEIQHPQMVSLLSRTLRDIDFDLRQLDHLPPIPDLPHAQPDNVAPRRERGRGLARERGRERGGRRGRGDGRAPQRQPQPQPDLAPSTSDSPPFSSSISPYIHVPPLDTSASPASTVGRTSMDAAESRVRVSSYGPLHAATNHRKRRRGTSISEPS